MDNHILELALEALEARKTAVAAEIEGIRSQLKGEAGIKTAKERKASVRPTGRRRPRTPAEKKAQSEKMKLYWAKRRAGAARNVKREKNKPH